VLSTVGQANLAAKVALASAAKSTLVIGMHAAFTLAGASFRSQRIPEALTVAAELAGRGDVDSRIAAFVLQSAVLARGPHLTEAEAAQAIETARVSLSATPATGDTAAAAGDAYNLGKSLFRAGRWQEAVDAFEQAAQFDADYEKRPYSRRTSGPASSSRAATTRPSHVTSERSRAENSDGGSRCWQIPSCTRAATPRPTQDFASTSPTTEARATASGD